MTKTKLSEEKFKVTNNHAICANLCFVSIMMSYLHNQQEITILKQWLHCFVHTDTWHNKKMFRALLIIMHNYD